MITRMTVENFKALRRVEVDLAPFTVLIGPNDTGKTSFLEAVYALSESTRNPLASCFWSPWQSRELVYKQTPDTPVHFAAELASRRPDDNGKPKADARLLYSLALAFFPGHACKVFEERLGLAGQQPSEVGNFKTSTVTAVLGAQQGAGISEPLQQQLRRVAELLPPAALARWDVEELAMPSRLPEQRRYPFDPSGYGLATCIAEMKLGRGEQFESLRDDFCAQFPSFQDVLIQRTTVAGMERNQQNFQKYPSSQGEGYALVLLRKDGVEIPAGLASGGTLVTLAFLTLIHLREPRKLLLIEEPENALHPGRLREIIPLLRRAISRYPDCQVILTTHSPLLLDHVEPEEVRVFLRNDQDDVEVYNVADVPDIRDRLKYLMLGELVYNEGEQELVKEIQQHAHPDPRRRAD
jgi:hypothetical protein